MKTKQLMLYREKTAVCSEIRTELTNTLCGQNVEFVNVRPGGTQSNHWALTGFKHLSEKRQVENYFRLFVFFFFLWATTSYFVVGGY
jgi:hypothetical protein